MYTYYWNCHATTDIKGTCVANTHGMGGGLPWSWPPLSLLTSLILSQLVIEIPPTTITHQPRYCSLTHLSNRVSLELEALQSRATTRLWSQYWFYSDVHCVCKFCSEFWISGPGTRLGPHCPQLTGYGSPGLQVALSNLIPIWLLVPLVSPVNRVQCSGGGDGLNLSKHLSFSTGLQTASYNTQRTG